jgi:hypothetical protein
MFNNQRYITKGIESTIPLMLQNYLWKLIGRMDIQLDYLQVFKLTVSDGKLMVDIPNTISQYRRLKMITIMQ